LLAGVGSASERSAFRCRGCPIHRSFIAMGGSESPTAHLRAVLTPPRRKPAIPLEEAVRRAVKCLTGAFAIRAFSSPTSPTSWSRGFGPACRPRPRRRRILPRVRPSPASSTNNPRHPLPRRRRTAILTPPGIALTDFDGAPIPLRIQRIAWDPIQAGKVGYKHFMLKGDQRAAPRRPATPSFGRRCRRHRPRLPLRDAAHRRRPPRLHSDHHRRPAAPVGTPASPSSS